MRPDIPLTWELERGARGHSGIYPNCSSSSVLGSIARQLLGWSPWNRWLASSQAFSLDVVEQSRRPVWWIWRPLLKFGRVLRNNGFETLFLQSGR